MVLLTLTKCKGVDLALNVFLFTTWGKGRVFQVPEIYFVY